MKKTGLTNIIKGATQRAGLCGKELAEAIGMPYQTLLYRYRNPGSWRLYELGAALRCLRLYDEEVKEIWEEIKA